ncbi:DNA mismatch repair protein MutS [Carnobacteriaceae bacterium zg-C25]|nr:DNA mismatch repair protein MutS [Carnobacteriaceae bacterium zg-C25]
MSVEQVTPMMAQYLAIKENYKDCLLFYRLGDFYELFHEDAIIASHELEIALTARNKNAANPVKMCGVPHHSATEYIQTLVDKGYKVAICEQVEDAKMAKGMVKREVVQVITPGTFMDPKVRDEKNNYYLVALRFENAFHLSYSDIGTGSLHVTSLPSLNEVMIELDSLNVAELVYDDTLSQNDLDKLSKRHTFIFSHATIDEALDNTHFAFLDSTMQQQVVALLLSYISKTQMRSLVHIQDAQSYVSDHFLKMDTNAKNNLEITQSHRQNGKKWSLLWLLDQTKTAMGGRMLRSWLDKPLIDPLAITQRYNQVDNLLNHFFERLDLIDVLKKVYDLERLVAKVSFGSVTPRELIQLKLSLEQVPIIKKHLRSMNANGEWDSLLNHLPDLQPLVTLIEQAIVDEPSISSKEGGIIRDGYNALLDAYRDAMTNGKQWIAQLQQSEREKTGVKTLKIGFNRVFGYYIEVTKGQLHALEEGRYERKQTLANAERFITPELKEKERLILEAQEKSLSLEYELFVAVRDVVKTHSQSLQQLAKSIASLDVLQSFAQVSEENHYVRPTLNESEQKMKVVSGRHPVVEKVIGIDKYVPNDIVLDQQQRLLLITGPNMSGKSTYMRQVALIAIMAQIGCFVPAQEAELPIFDRIFTRIGAADDLVSGQSTFMVEMMETNVALQQASAKSLLLFDEIGRGTATYDGMALAEAILRYVHQKVQALSIFSTHYHELTVLEKELDELHNIHVGAVEQRGELIFLHKIQDGPADKSYGLHVAQLAGLPKALIADAAVILKQLETGTHLHAPAKEIETVSREHHPFEEMMMFISAIDINQTSPLEALMLLQHIQQKMKEKEE